MKRQKKLQLCLDFLPPCFGKAELSIRGCREKHRLCPTCGDNGRIECPIDLTKPDLSKDGTSLWRLKKERI